MSLSRWVGLLRVLTLALGKRLTLSNAVQTEALEVQRLETRARSGHDICGSDDIWRLVTASGGPLRINWHLAEAFKTRFVDEAAIKKQELESTVDRLNKELAEALQAESLPRTTSEQHMQLITAGVEVFGGVTAAFERGCGKPGTRNADEKRLTTDRHYKETSLSAFNKSSHDFFIKKECLLDPDGFLADCRDHLVQGHDFNTSYCSYFCQRYKDMAADDSFLALGEVTHRSTRLKEQIQKARMSLFVLATDLDQCMTDWANLLTLKAHLKALQDQSMECEDILMEEAERGFAEEEEKAAARSIAVSPRAAVREISGKMGHATDHVEFKMADGSVRSYGGTGGEQEGRWNLKKDEVILAVMQEVRPQHPHYIGNAIVFYTSYGRSLPLEGSNAHKRARFVAPQGTQIAGLHFENSHLVGVLLEKIVGGKGAVASIRGRADHFVDKVVMQLRDGSERSYGEDGGQESALWALSQDESILVVEQVTSDNYLGMSVTFFTSTGKFIRLSGLREQVQVRRFTAPQGTQICGLQFSGPDLMRVATCPQDGSRAEEGDPQQEQLHEVNVS